MFASLHLQACSSDPVAAQDAGTGNPDSGTIVVQDSGTAPDADAAAAEADGGSDAATLTQADAYCAALASHGTCPDQSPRVCSTNEKCMFGKMFPESAAAFNQCYASPSCKSQDPCIVAAGKAKGTAAAPNYVAVCMGRHTACGNAFDDENCSEVVFAWPGVAEAASACLAKDCADIKPCIDAIGEGLEVCP